VAAVAFLGPGCGRDFETTEEYLNPKGGKYVTCLLFTIQMSFNLVRGIFSFLCQKGF
jgi:hypothetical protein